MNTEILSTTAIPQEQSKPPKPKRSDTDRLKECYDQQKKLLEQQTAARKKSKDIEKRISDNNAKIAELENKEFFKICREKKISTQELIKFLKKIPENVSFENLANTAVQKSQQLSFNSTGG